MFEAKLKSRSQPKLGALAVTFPIPEERYENVILALQNLQIGDVRKQDCCIESIRAPDCPALLRMTNTMANVDELDWLGKQLESFDRYELLQFNAAVERFGLSAADELIDLSFCARDVTVVSDFNDLELVGKRHYLTVHGACDPKELENLDGKETALALISGQPGYVTRYGVVYDNGIKLEQAYDRKHLPPIWMPESCIMELKLRATGEDDPKKQEWVQLPASRMKLERAIERAMIEGTDEAVEEAERIKRQNDSPDIQMTDMVDLADSADLKKSVDQNLGDIKSSMKVLEADLKGIKVDEKA